MFDQEPIGFDKCCTYCKGPYGVHDLGLCEDCTGRFTEGSPAPERRLPTEAERIAEMRAQDIADAKAWDAELAEREWRTGGRIFS